MTTMKDRDARERRTYERLGTTKPRCGCCPENDWRCIDAHHVAGRKRDAFTVPLCANCHRKATDSQKDHPLLDDNSDRLLETVGHFLLGLADLCALLVVKLKELAQALLDRAKANQAAEA